MAAPGRVEVMNASPTHSKVRLKLHLSSDAFVAGEDITGKLELESRADKGLALGSIVVELIGSQELSSRDHSAMSTFLQTQRFFQGPGLPPSNAVHPFPHLAPTEDPLPRDYYPARKGITTFFYQLPVPSTSPSSVDFNNGVARVRYTIRASVQVMYRGDPKVVTCHAEASVIETLSDDSPPEIRNVTLAEGGKIWAQGTLMGGYAVTGSEACIALHLKNQTARASIGIALSLVRKLTLSLSTHQSQPLLQPHLIDTPLTRSFKEPEYCVTASGEGYMNIVFNIPKNARGVRGGLRMDVEGRTTGCLFELQSVAQIKILFGGLGGKDVLLDLNLPILHPKAVPFIPPDPYMVPSPLEPPHPAFHQYRNHPPQYNHQHSHSPSPTPSPFEPHSPIFRAHPGPASPKYFSPHAQCPSPSPSPHYPHGYPTSPHHQPPFLPRYTTDPYPYQCQAESGYPFYLQQQQQQPGTPPRQLLPQEKGYMYYSPQNAYYAQPPSNIAGQPPRPSSTEPQHQSNVVDHQLQPLQEERQETSHRDEQENVAVAVPTIVLEDPNKGARSRRVSNHLRITSHNTRRGRSASPPASRSQLLSSRADEAPPPILVSPKRSPSVISPRPLLSPRQSYDNTASGGTAKSVRVEELERQADEVEKRNKTLPITPTPSAVGKLHQVKEDEELDVKELLAREGILPLERRLQEGRTGGLDALEKRLLADVGTKKVIVSKPLVAVGAREGAGLKTPTISDVFTDTTKFNPALKASPKSPKSETVSATGDGKERESEMRKMRKDAKSRVKNWLTLVGDDEMAEEDNDESGLATPTKAKPTNIAAALPTPLTEVTQTNGVPKTRAAKTQPAVKDSPPKAAEKQNIVAPRTPVVKYQTPPASDSPKAKYDVRSARGGKGGIVTSVTSLWSSPNAVTPPKAQKPIAKTNLRPPALLSTPAASAPSLSSQPQYPPSPKQSTPTSDAKSPITPALLSSKLATPVMSSTASLARPVEKNNRPKAAPIMSSIPEDEPPAAKMGADLPLGRAKLRDLIKKYEGAAV